MPNKNQSQKPKRTEEAILAHDGFEVILGGKKYEIAPLVIREAREWRKAYAEASAGMFGLVAGTLEKAEDFQPIYKDMLTKMPDQTIDLFFQYAKDLDREEIEGTANEHEIADAFAVLVEFALPLSKSLAKAMGRTAREKDSQ